MTFELQFHPALIRPLAARFGETDDAAPFAAGAAARARGHYTRAEFLLVCAWKTARSATLIRRNSPAQIRTATRRAFATRDEAARVEALTSLAGVGVPTASTLLYFAFPEDYPILDYRALEALGVKPRSTYPLSFWLDYLTACRELAKRHDVSVRTLDKALWQWSKERGLAPRRPT
jgi:hypothetical protein